MKATKSEQVVKNQLNATFRILLTTSFLLAGLQGFSQTHTNVSEGIFPKGKQGPASNFTGKAYNYGLVAEDSTN